MTDVDVRKLAELARIAVSDEEVVSLEDEIPQIIRFVEQVQEAHLTSAKTAARTFDKIPGTHRNVMRDDTDAHEAGAYSDELLEALPERSGDYAKVKQVIKRQ